MRRSAGVSRRPVPGRRPAGVLSALLAVLAVLFGGPPVSSPVGSAALPGHARPGDHSAAVTDRVAVAGVLSSSGRASLVGGEDHHPPHSGMPAAVPARHGGHPADRHRALASAPRPATATAHHTPRPGRAPPGSGALRDR
ncbi:hypothetical protein [Streptomyces albus]|uniref:hypothetical protein n=1 Tax=Streptomyces albus TaxID=1888 RepID=UPI0004C4BBFC|nr:hypothetical protein [Streptomyces albus]